MVVEVDVEVVVILVETVVWEDVVLVGNAVVDEGPAVEETSSQGGYTRVALVILTGPLPSANCACQPLETTEPAD